ncbi:hypothetical protein SAMN04487770_13846 [Butyrivibrio sp. ob235]|uniref:hypothetical protein n=1 Tax=Butyrivibrio sp. ob235 TaxID=1761780 RepID=UPI0008C0EB46|nr:hypothetical protein [Butyrivibrio sp. ob235]SEM42893.1 hypothetical protein SAMN04487770_13846 [Butyrivibrio sp. ob235]
MNESIYGSRDSKNTGTTQYGDDTGRTKSLGSKLKNKDTARKYYGEMLRGERTTKELEPEEARRRAKIMKFGKIWTKGPLPRPRKCSMICINAR